MAFALNEAIDLNGRWVRILGLPFAYIIHKTYKTQAEKLDAEVERREASDKMASLYLSVVETLSNAIDMKDHRTHTHVRRVHLLAQAVGERMGLQGAQIEAVRIGAVLHDIGKLAVPDHILRKPGRLTDAEFSMVKEHPRAGEAILRPIDFGVPVAEIVRHHHEKLDGSGYPDGLQGDQISIGARVLAVIDVYDALVADRPYRKAWTTEQALSYLRQEASRSFDAEVVEALAAVIADGEGESCPDGAAEPMTEEVLPAAGTHDPAPVDEVLIARVAEEARRNVLRGLAEFVAGRGSFLATVIYEVIGASGEIDAVAALGPCAPCFQLARIPLGLGTSSQAAHFRCPATGAAAGEFEAFPEGVPPELSRAQVTAVPLVGADGATLAVISVYYMDRALGLAIERDDEIRSVAAVAARQMELIGEGLLPPPRRETPALAPILQSVPAGGS
jgi:putative nucleotidyltransferase with HDIG domain